MVELALLAALAAAPAPPLHARTPAKKIRPVSAYPGQEAAHAFSYDFAQPQRVEVGGGPTRVSTETAVPTPTWGYVPMRVSIDNSMGPSQTLLVRYTGNVGGGSRTVERRVEVGSGTRSTVVLPVPSDLRYGNLSVKGPGITERGEVHLYFGQSYRPQRAVLSLGAPADFEKLAGMRPVNSDPLVMVLPMPAADAPAELAAYVGYDAVAVAGQPLEELSPAVQRALEAYAATGGTLVLASAGRGTLAALPLLPQDAAPGDLLDYGFGRVAIQGGALDVGAPLLGSDPVVNPFGIRPSWQRRGLSGSGTDDVLLPQAMAPLGRFLLIITFFTLLIGPGSVWVARRRGPGALLVTIPTTAAVTCLLIVGYSLVRDGFTVHAGTHGYTLLDRERNRALTVGASAFYANLAPGKAVFPATAVAIAPWEGNPEAQAASLVWGDGARFGSDFLPSRSYREWGLLGVEPTRARLVVKDGAGGPRVQNALGHRVRQVWVRQGGEDFHATELRDGGETPLKKGRPPDEGLEPEPARRFDGAAGVRVMKPLEDGEFLAVLEGPGFTPLGGLRLMHHDSRHVVRGEVTP